ncbi:preATP grasp domain-containing protein [Nonomuraea sp. NPDC003727]
MTRLIIGNGLIEEIRTDNGPTGWWIQRLAWFAQEGDVMVLPVEPDPEFLAYVGGLTDVDPESWTVVVAPRPEGARDDEGVLTAERLDSEDLQDILGKALEMHEIDEVFAVWPDVSVARLVARLGLRSALPGYGFIEQSGGPLVISKATFRAIAAGVGVPIPPGAVLPSRSVALDVTEELLRRYDTVILKHDWMAGGRGNEILSAVDGVRPVGASRVVPVGGRGDLESYFAEHWSWLSSDGRARPVVEQFIPDSSTYFAEFKIDDSGVTRCGGGEVLLAPQIAAFVLPAPYMTPEIEAAFDDGASKLAQAARAIGHRGYLNPDAIVTPDEEVFFTEWNGRLSGGTHVMSGIGGTVVGPSFPSERMILDRVWPPGWSVSTFEDARRRLEESGLAYDQGRREGVILTTPFDGQGAVMYCIVARDANQAWQIDHNMAAVFAHRVRGR